jgi:hypothetical protein
VDRRIKSTKNHNDPIGNWICKLTACSMVPQPTAPPHTPSSLLPNCILTRIDRFLTVSNVCDKFLLLIGIPNIITKYFHFSLWQCLVSVIQTVVATTIKILLFCISSNGLKAASEIRTWGSSPSSSVYARMLQNDIRISHNTFHLHPSWSSTESIYHTLQTNVCNWRCH